MGPGFPLDSFLFCTQPSPKNKPVCCNDSMLSLRVCWQNLGLYSNTKRRNESREPLILLRAQRTLKHQLACLDQLCVCTLLLQPLLQLLKLEFGTTHTHTKFNFFSLHCLFFCLSCFQLAASFLLALNNNNKKKYLHFNWFLYCYVSVFCSCWEKS